MYTTSTVRNVAMALGLAVAPCFLSSCNKDEAKPSNGGFEVPDSQFPEVNVPSIDGNKAMTAEEQKNYIDEVGKVLLSEFDSKNFAEVIDLINFINSQNSGEDAISKSSGNKWDWSAVEDWADDCMEALTVTNLGNTLELDYERSYGEMGGYNISGTDIIFSDYYGDSYNGYYYYDNNRDEQYLTNEQVEKLREITIIENTHYYDDLTKTSRLYQVSKFKGDFKLVDNKWQKSESDGLKFEFTDDQGKPCVLKLETSGNTVSVYGDYDDDRDWSNRTNEQKLTWNADKTVATLDYTRTTKVDREERVIEVPENITITLTRDGKEIFKTVTKTNLEVASSSEYNVNKDSYAVSNVVYILDYNFHTQEAGYSSKDNSAKVVFAINHGTSKLLQMEGSATAKFNMDEEDVYDLEMESGSGNISIDILGKIQVKGSILDAKALFDAMDEADDNDEDAAAYKAAIDKANKQLDLSLYFNNGSTKQCKVVLEPVEEEGWNYTYWTYNFAVQFEDGTRFAFDDYAGDNDFLGVRDLFESMQDDYENKLDF